MIKPISHQIIETKEAPGAIGAYSQAVKAGNTLYISGQIPLDPATGDLVDGDIEAQIERVFDNLAAVAKAAGTTLAHVVKFTIYLTDMADFAAVNTVMQARLDAPYPARAAVGVAALPKGARVEADAILVLG
ncbi:RidA family protein [Salinisphaera aquimarina]|uniref:RidA family protein n=1 Tax=Salinisphaera aquimarina TaxID=2094031 RepID=A0ABV7EIV9_9GAMM